MPPQNRRTTTSRDTRPVDDDMAEKVPPGLRPLAEDEHHDPWVEPIRREAEYHAGQEDLWTHVANRLERELHEARVNAEAHGQAGRSLREVIAQFEDSDPRMEKARY